MKQITILLTLLLSACLATAQDNLYLRKGEVMEVRIKKVGGNLIYYTSPGGGPQRFIRKNAVEKIVYKNGREVVLKDPAARKRNEPTPTNLMSVSLNALLLGDVSGLGLGLDYEHYFGERRRISMHVPVYIGFLSNQQTDANGQLTSAFPYTEIIPFYTAPGVHYHPINPRKRLDYAVGISVVIGNAHQTMFYEKSWLGGQNVDEQYLLTAITLDNDLNIFSRKKFAFGLHTGFGPVVGNFGADGKWLVQVGLKLGFRF